MRSFTIAFAALLLASTGCATAPAGAGGAVSDCRGCGTVRSIDAMDRGGGATGAGAVMGAVIGGVVGHQFGSGRGQDAATAAGAVGGAAAGHQAEKQYRDAPFYRVGVRMDSGELRDIDVANPGGLRVGDRVRVSGRNLEVLEG
jgi:outer membrane lipoprotein SlyB